MSILQRLSALSRVISPDTSNFQYINAACHYFINSLPPEISNDFYVESEVIASGTSCGTKYSSVIRDGIPCRLINRNYKHLASKNGSEFEVSKDDPVFYKEHGKVFVLPAPTVDEKAYLFKIPTSFIPTGAASNITEIPNVPENSYEVILLYAGFIITFKMARDAKIDVDPIITEVNNSISDFENALPSPLSFPAFSFADTIPVKPALNSSVISASFSLSDLPSFTDEISITFNESINLSLNDLKSLSTSIVSDLNSIDVDFSGIVAGLVNFDWNAPGNAFPNIEEFPSIPSVDTSAITSAMEALQSASRFIGKLSDPGQPSANPDVVNSTNVPTGAFWLDDEDPEMVQSAVQLAAQEINRANAVLTNETSKFQPYIAIINTILQKFQARVTKITSEIEAKSAFNAMKIQEFTAEIQKKSQEISSKIEKVNLKLQGISVEMNRLVEIARIEYQEQLSKSQIEIERRNILIARFNSKLNEFQSKYQSVLQRETLKFQDVQSLVTQKIQDNQNIIQLYSQELNAYSLNFQSKISEYSTNVQAKVSEFSSNIQLASASLSKIEPILATTQLKTNDYSVYMSEAMSLYERYQVEFRMFAGIYESQ